MTSNTLVQYILVRSDLKTALAWPLGAVVAQACHAATAAVHVFRDQKQTQVYLEDLDNMHKVVLSVSDEVKLATLSEKLETAGVDFVLWREQPENILTALALRPYMKKEVQVHFKEFPLLS